VEAEMSLSGLSKLDILRGLLSETVNAKEVMHAYDIITHDVELHGGIAAFVYNSRAGYYHIFINEAMSPEAKKSVLMHEIYHIVEDMPKKGYSLGLDKYGVEELAETRADLFAKEVAATYALK